MEEKIRRKDIIQDTMMLEFDKEGMRQRGNEIQGRTKQQKWTKHERKRTSSQRPPQGISATQRY